MERKNRYYVASIQTITPQNLLPGGLELLKELRQAGIKIAIGSVSKNARSVIEKLHLNDYVDAIVANVILPNPINFRWSNLRLKLRVSVRADD